MKLRNQAGPLKMSKQIQISAQNSSKLMYQFQTFQRVQAKTWPFLRSEYPGIILSFIKIFKAYLASQYAVKYKLH